MSELQDRIDDARVVADAVSALDLPMPEVSQDPDGDIVFEWYLGQRRLVTVWSRDHHISYAGRWDDELRHGRSEDLEVLPPGCRELLLRFGESGSQRDGGSNG